MTTRLQVHGTPVDIEPADGVFTPTQHGLFYAEQVTVRSGERVIDIGTGSGILAIYAAKVGAKVFATDVDARAVQAACRNAELNGVDINCKQGAMFGEHVAEPCAPFDVILANLPNEIVAPAALARLEQAEAVSVAGGKRGNALLLELLETAPKHMHQFSRLYLPVHSLTDWHGTLRAALATFQSRLVGFADLPAKQFVLDELPFYRDLDERGVITLFQKDGGWFTRGYVFELTLPAR